MMVALGKVSQAGQGPGKAVEGMRARYRVLTRKTRRRRMLDNVIGIT
jgi:hypothetical protein